jgi:putative membrane protein
LKYLSWLFKATLFFTLFAFALNNQHEASVNFFFGHQWQAPLVLVVLVAFAAGLALGVLVMVPRWWRSRRAVRPEAPPPPAAEPPSAAQAPHGI